MNATDASQASGAADGVLPDSGDGTQAIERALSELLGPGCAVSAVTYPLGPQSFQAEPAGRHPRREAEFAAGRRAARIALERLGVPSAEIPVNPDRSPRWPQGIAGSITHARGIAAAAVARREHHCSLGVDLERAGAVGPGLWGRLLTRGELATLRAQPLEQQGDLATVYFCAKEAFYKLQHPVAQVWLEFQEAEVSLDPSEGAFSIGCRQVRLVERLGAGSWTGGYRLVEGWVVAALQLGPAASTQRPAAQPEPGRKPAVGLEFPDDSKGPEKR